MSVNKHNREKSIEGFRNFMNLRKIDLNIYSLKKNNTIDIIVNGNIYNFRVIEDLQTSILPKITGLFIAINVDRLVLFGDILNFIIDLSELPVE